MMEFSGAGRLSTAVVVVAGPVWSPPGNYSGGAGGTGFSRIAHLGREQILQAAGIPPADLGEMVEVTRPGDPVRTWLPGLPEIPANRGRHYCPQPGPAPGSTVVCGSCRVSRRREADGSVTGWSYDDLIAGEALMTPANEVMPAAAIARTVCTECGMSDLPLSDKGLCPVCAEVAENRAALGQVSRKPHEWQATAKFFKWRCLRCGQATNHPQMYGCGERAGSPHKVLVMSGVLVVYLAVLAALLILAPAAVMPFVLGVLAVVIVMASFKAAKQAGKRREINRG